MKNNKGYTISELLFVGVIMVITLMALVATVTGVNYIFQSVKDTAMVESDVRVIGRLVAKDIKGSAASKISITQDSPYNGTDMITLFLPVMLDTDGDDAPDTPDLSSGSIQWDTDPVKIRLEGGDTGNLMRIHGDTSAVLIGNVKRINFIDHNVDSSLYLNEVKIIIEVEHTGKTGRTYNIVSTFIVNMRNS